MGESDDTTGEAPGAPPAGDEERPRRRPLGYYYDDGTGYEVYDPARDDEPDEAPEGGPSQHTPRPEFD